MSEPAALKLAHRIENAKALDPPAAVIASTLGKVLSSGLAKDTLSGAWLGHALHPLLTDLPIGTFTSAALLDLFGGDSGAAAEKLILVGLLATPATIATGWSDWADAEARSPAVRRSGIVHALTNATGVGVMAASLVSRRRGARGRGTLLGLTGVSIMGAAGWLGGHLSYTLGAGVAAGAPARGAQAQTGQVSR